MSTEIFRHPFYNVAEVLYEDNTIAAYRGIATSNRQSVVIKLLKAEYPTLRDIARLKHEYEITRNLDIAGIIKPYEIISYNNGLALILEDFGGKSLKSLMLSSKLELIDFLSLAIQITQTLGELHSHNIIHKNIKPHNIFFNSDTGKVKLTDFSIASLLSKENPEINSPNLLEGTLAYMSPEQTGRMNRTVDYRTDLYSIGVTFYELLTGQLPFGDAHDPMELVHCHIAKIPVSPHDRNIAVPTVISALVMKLLAKTAEERYQSAYGLKADLEQCQIQLQTKDNIDEFPLGQQDLSNQFQIPQKLYGREVEVQTLMAAFERVSHGNTEMMLVGGYSGIGKSSLVNEIHRPITRQRGYCISGKFDQFKRNVPYASLIQAFQELMRQLLTESQPRLEVWRQKLFAALGHNGQIIIDVIPEVELIIGKQPTVSVLSPTEAQTRFNLVFKEFIHVFTDSEHPLVLFLDDLQWADSASLKLIQLLMSDQESGYLFLIGAYRDNEVNLTHPLMLTLDAIRSGGATVEAIALAPLAVSDITQLIADTLNCQPEKAESLATLLFHKTQGNPFFFTQLLKSLYQDGLLTFNNSSGKWQWNIEQIKNLAITDNVVELMVGKIQKLSESTQQILKLAACINNRFNLNVLALVSEQSPTQTAANLWEALLAGLILPLGDTYKIPQVLQQSELETFCTTALQVDYKFLHDRVQQAAYSLIPEEQKQQVHLKVGQLLLRNTSLIQLEEYIFDIVNHLNLGQALITETNDRYELAELNLLAGRRAKSSSAFETALKLVKVGMNCLPEQSWQENYSLTLRIYLETGESEYLNGNNESALVIFKQTLSHVNNLLEKCQVNEYKIMCYRMQNDLNSAYKIGLSTLNLLGINFEPFPDDDYLLRELQTTKAVIGNRDIDSLAELPQMQDPEKLVQVRILKEVWPIAYFLGSKALHLCAHKITQLSIQYGNSPISVFGYMLYSFCLVFRHNEVKLGCEMGELSLKLHEVFKTKDVEANIFNMWGGLILHYKEHISQGKPYLLQGFNSGLETGSYQWSGYCSVNFLWQSLFGNESLKKTAEIADSFIPTLKKIDKNMLNYHLLAKELIANLTESSELRAELSGESVDEYQVLEFAIKSADLLTVFVIYIYKLSLCNWYGDFTKAVEYAELAEKYVEGAEGIFINPVFYFHQSIALARVYTLVTVQQQSRYLNKLTANLEKLKKWAEHCPQNYQHKYLLIQAEGARISGQDYQAMELYDRAIADASEQGYQQNVALANEIAAQFYLSKGRTKFAKVYLKEARYRYLKWGASGKVRQLDERFCQLCSTTEITQTDTDHKGELSILDLHTVIKASQTLSSEILLEQLQSKLMTIVIENAGAQKGCLVVQKEEQWEIVVQANISTPATCAINEDRYNLPILLLNYVERTKENLVLDDARDSDLFADDPYIMTHQPRSVLCSPIIYQGKLTGILYLENNLTTGVFTPDRLRVLTLITSQVSISMENAHLYKDLQTYSQQLEISEAKEREKAQQLEEALDRLKCTQAQMVQSEKMSSLGQLVAGIAHEINNPVNFIYGNLTHVNEYTKDLMGLVQLYQQSNPTTSSDIQDEIEAIDLEFLMEDLPKMLASMKLGAHRIRQIVLSLRNFSRLDESEANPFNIHDGIDSTLMILQNRLKAKHDCPEIEVVKEYGDLPLVECYAGQLNQVFMNLVANAIDALEESLVQKQGSMSAQNTRQTTHGKGLIRIRTEMPDSQRVLIGIADNGPGMSETVKNQLFNPFFTTKLVGKGTGLGLSISHQIVTEKHGGQLECVSSPGEGAEFIITLPVKQTGS